LVALSAWVVTASAACAACPAGGRCDDTTSSVAPVVVHAEAPVVLFGAPPIGYALDPSDARTDLYFVNQGPVYGGPNIVRFGQPTYSESGFAYAMPYPYVHFYTGAYGQTYYRARRQRFYGYRSPAHAVYDAYRYRPAASARVIDVAPR
jgi:hypothetical protein